MGVYGALSFFVVGDILDASVATVSLSFETVVGSIRTTWLSTWWCTLEAVAF